MGIDETHTGKSVAIDCKWLAIHGGREMQGWLRAGEGGKFWLAKYFLAKNFDLLEVLENQPKQSPSRFLLSQ